MEIIQITASATSPEGHEIFGLSNQQQIYRWDWYEGEWKIYKQGKN